MTTLSSLPSRGERRRSLAGLAGLLLLVPACSPGGGGSASSADSSSRVLLVDTRTGGDAGLELRADVLALEAADGSFTGNLAPAGATLPIARTSGTPAGVRLSSVPTGRYAALRMIVADGGVSATDSDGTRAAVAIPSRELRVPIAGDGSLGGGTRWLLLEHASAPVLVRGAGKALSWTPSLQVRLGDAHALAGATLSVASIQSGEVIGTLTGCGDLAVHARVDDSSQLSDDGGSRDRSTFLAGLRGGDDLECSGVLTADGTLHVSSAHRRGRGGSVGADAKVYGRITALHAEVPAVEVQVQEIVRSSPGLSADPLPLLTVGTSGAHIHRSGSPGQRLDFTALAVGQRVEVEWRGAVVDGAVEAHQVGIEDDAGGGGGGGGIGGEIEGEVGSIDRAAGSLVAVPRGDDPLVVGGRSVPSATIVVGAGTVVTREVDGGDRRIVTLDAAVVGDRVWVLGRVVGAQRVEASLVRLRERR